MTEKIGRNDPCPCGSGKKYKHCCGRSDADIAPERKGHDGGVERALDWLTTRHRKAVGVAIQEMLFEGLSDEERSALDGLDQDTWQAIQLNATERLLAEGQILVKGEARRVAEVLLGPGGPLFTADQRGWITQLAERPLRLYEVTGVIPGKQMTLCDALDTDAEPIVAHERSGSQESLLGTQIGLRLMEVGDHWELSGATYPFSRLTGPTVITLMREAIEAFGPRREDLPGFLSSLLRRKWLEQFVAPAPMPTLMDAYSGEPILLITDHYRVKDWDALTQALADQADVQGDRTSGWDRLLDGSDGQTRATVTINIGNGKDKIEVFYKTQRMADTGRPWFEALAGHAVQFLSRELSDPKGVMARMSDDGNSVPAFPPPDLPPELMAEAIEQAIHRYYANWADEPIPALNGKTPREAIQSLTGLERVKGLLREYEAGEKQQAAQQRRRAISYAFLWEALGIAPGE